MQQGPRSGVRPEAGNEFVSRVLVLGLGYATLLAGGGVVGAVAVYALADVLSAVALTMYGRRRLPRPVAPRHVQVSVHRVARLALIVVLDQIRPGVEPHWRAADLGLEGADVVAAFRHRR